MPNVNDAYVGDDAVVRLAAVNEARAAIEKAIENAAETFRATWARWGRHVVFLVQESPDSIDDAMATDILTEINMVRRWTPIDIVLHTHGGFSRACERIAEALVHRPNTAAFVPHYAMSGGTQIALATQKIYFGSGANLGTLDVHVDGIPVRDILNEIDKAGDALSLGVRIDAKELRRIQTDETRRTCRLINRKHKHVLEGWCRLAKYLTNSDLPHGARLTYRDARRLNIRCSRWVHRARALYRFVDERRAQLRELHELDKALQVITAATAEQPPETSWAPKGRPGGAH